MWHIIAGTESRAGHFNQFEREVNISCRTIGSFVSGSRPSSLTGQPHDQIVSAASARRVNGGEFVVSDPIDVGTTFKKVLRRFTPTPVACTPKGVRDLIWCECHAVIEERLNAIHQAQGRSLPEVSRRAALDEAPRGLPLPECNSIGKWRAAADACAIRFDVRAVIEQRIKHRNVIAACGPMERGFCVLAYAPRIDIGSVLNQYSDGLSAVWKVAGPVGRNMQERAGFRFASSESRRRQAGIFFEQTGEGGCIAEMDCLNGRHRERSIGF
jgi:hypothetical protein